MGGTIQKLELLESRPDFGPDQLGVEDLESGMAVELVEGDRARAMGVVAVGKRYRDPHEPDKNIRRQSYVGDPGTSQLEIVDDPGWVIVAEAWGIGRKTPELLPLALELDRLGLGPIQSPEGTGWRKDTYLRRRPQEQSPDLMAAILGTVLTSEPIIKTRETTP